MQPEVDDRLSILTRQARHDAHITQRSGAMNLPWNTRQPADKWTASIEDIRQQIGHQIDRLAKLASEAGRDVYGQAAQISTDTGAQVGAAARDLGDQAARAGQGAKSQAAVTASTLAQQAMRGAAQLGRDIRSVRITREPPRRSPDFMPGIALLAGVGSGLAIMYFFDPGEGRRRRALLRDQLVKWTRIGRETAEGKAKDVRNRATGVMYEARKQVGGTAEADQPTDTYAEARARVEDRNEQPVTTEIV
jgi:hypothetical protein